MAMVVVVTCIRSDQEGHVLLRSAAPTYCTILGTIRLCPRFPEPFKNTQMNHSSCHWVRLSLCQSILSGHMETNVYAPYYDITTSVTSPIFQTVPRVYHKHLTSQVT